jgi:anti-anti-sigma factor
MTTAYDRSRISPHGWDGHILLLHGSESERWSDLAAWVRRGLENDEKVIYAEAGGTRPERSVMRILRDKGIDADAAASEGRLTVTPLLESCPPQGPEWLAEMVDRALAEGYRGLRISAEASAALTVMPEDAHSEVERSVDRLCRTHRLSALCQYDQARTVGDLLQDAASSHACGSIRQGALHIAQHDDRLVLVGEIDLSNQEVLACAVRAAADRTSGALRLDLSQVDFLGAAGCHALHDGTIDFRAQGGRVQFIAPKPRIERVLRLAGIVRLEHVELTVLPGIARRTGTPDNGPRPRTTRWSAPPPGCPPARTSTAVSRHPQAAARRTDRSRTAGTSGHRAPHRTGTTSCSPPAIPDGTRSRHRGSPLPARE